MPLREVASRLVTHRLRPHSLGLANGSGVCRASLRQLRPCGHVPKASGGARRSWADRWRAFQEDWESDNSSDGWLYGYALDGQGGVRQLEPWDAHVCEALSRLQQKQDGGDGRCDDEQEADAVDTHGFWIHIDFTRAKNVQWLWDVVQTIGCTDALVDGEDMRMEDMRTLWLSRLAEDDRVSLPRCEISSDADALFLSFRVGFLANSAGAGPGGMSVVEVRICLAKNLLLTTSVGTFPENSGKILPEICQSLLEGRGSKSCGELVAAILDRATARSTSTAQDAYESVLKLRANFQSKSLAGNGSRPIGRKELATLSQRLSLIRYDATRLSRNLTQQENALQRLSSFAHRRKQKVFSRADATRCRQAFERQDALDKTLDDVGGSAEVLHSEIMTHINWGTAESTYRLTYLGGICSVLIMINIGASLYEFSERQRLGLQSKNARYIDHYFETNDIS